MSMLTEGGIYWQFTEVLKSESPVREEITLFHRVTAPSLLFDLGSSIFGQNETVLTSVNADVDLLNNQF